jgi:ATP-dependent DNA helicase RecQ
MPTGGGNQFVFNTRITISGITIVISPLIALMKDQVDG